MSQKFTINFLREQLAPVVAELNAGNTILRELVDSWLTARRDYSRWRVENPKLAQRLDRLKMEAVLDPDSRNPLALFTRVAHGPSFPRVSRCIGCHLYFITNRKDKIACCRPHLIDYRVKHGLEIAFAEKLASIPLLLKKLPLDADWKSHLAKRGVSRWFATRAQTNGFLNDSGELTQKAFALFDRLRFPWQ